MEKILGNLFPNALKHTPEHGRITLTAKVITGGELINGFDYSGTTNGNMLYITMSNNGKQIPDDKLPNMFKRYYQIKEVNQNHDYGFGSGKSYCGLDFYFRSLGNTAIFMYFCLDKEYQEKFVI